MSGAKCKGVGIRRGAKRKLACDSNEMLEKMARLQLEEVMTQARLRKCPRCKTAVVKEGGCNLVNCDCGQVFCFTCGNPVHRCGFPVCRFQRNMSASEAVRRLRERLRIRYPALTFKECTTLLADITEEEECDATTTSSI